MHDPFPAQYKPRLFSGTNEQYPIAQTGVGHLIAVASGTFLYSHKGLAGFALESNMIANRRNTTAYVGATIFALRFLSAC